jgi:hypothetical protein
MNTKLALSAIVAALMLTACAKQESAGSDQAANPPAPAAPAGDQSQPANPPSGTAGGESSQGQMAPNAGGTSTPPAEGTPPANPPAENQNPPPKQQ